MFQQIENEEKQLKALASALRKAGLSGKVVESTYTAAKKVEPDQVERALSNLGWACKQSGMYYTSMTSFGDMEKFTGIYEKDGVQARVRWGSTSSSNPPTVVLRSAPVAA